MLFPGHRLQLNQKPPAIMAMDIQSNSASPLTSHLHHLNLIEAVAYPKEEQTILEATKIFLQTEGLLLAPESAYSIRGAINKALICKKQNEEKVIVALVSATSYLDFGARNKYSNPINYR